MNTNASNLIVVNCMFFGNGAHWGGGMGISYGDSVLTGCTFWRNRAWRGGGLYFSRSSSTLSSCTFLGNSAWEFGGGLYNRWSSPTLTECTFSGNSAEDYGGGIYNYENDDLTLTNCTLSGNSAANGRSFASDFDNQRIRGIVDMTNCILWNGGDEIRKSDNSTITVSYSSVQDEDPDDETVYPGEGNIDDDPLFVDADGPDDIPGNEDDNLRLMPGSPCNDSGDNTAVPSSVTTDLDGFLRFVNDPLAADVGVGPSPIVDMGAYERQAVQLDIQPGRCPNRVNPKSNSLLRMAIVGNDSFDVAQIKTDSLVVTRHDGIGHDLAPVMTGSGWTMKFRDVAATFAGDLCDCQKSHGDGIDDLVITMEMRDVTRALRLNRAQRGTSIMLRVEGVLQDGTPFEASDCIQLIGGRRSSK